MPVSNPVQIVFVANVTSQTFTDAKMAGAQWDFQGISGECESGKFVTNSTATESTTNIELSGHNSAGTDSSYILNVGVGNFIRFTDVNAQTVAYLITSMVPADADPDCISIGVLIQGGHTPWAGRYVIDFQPGTGA